MEYESSIKTDKEFREKFNKLFYYFKNKAIKNTAETALFKRLIDVRNYIENNTSLPYKKESYNNMLPYFELGGGWELMESREGEEATDILWYFVNRYNNNE